MNKKFISLVVKSLCSVLLISALVLSYSFYSNDITIAGRDEVIGEIVSADTIDVAGRDEVIGEIVQANIIDVAGRDEVIGEIVQADTLDLISNKVA